MPNRNPAESDPEYQKLMTGHSPDKGFIHLTPQPVHDTDEPGQKPTGVPSQSRIGVREKISRLFRTLWN